MDGAAPAHRISDYFQRVLSPKADREDPNCGIHVRRFAGPMAYADRMEPLRIAHLTDLHVGRVTPIKVHRAAVELTNREKPDLVVITGDFVCHSQMYLDALEDVVKGFDAPVIGVLGNHDHWSGAEEVRRALRRGGVEILTNRNTVIRLRRQPLQVVGLDDAYTSHARRDEAVKGLVPELPTLGLSHIAEEADHLFHHDVPLVLSGHTHAGQITLARMHELTLGRLVGHRYLHGLYGTRNRQANEPGGAVYVGAGIGSSIIPFRIGERAQREVTIFELGTAPGTFDEHHPEQAPLQGRKPSARAKARRAAAVAINREKRERRSSKKI